MLVSTSRSPHGIITPYKCALLPPLLLVSNTHLTRCRASQSIRQNFTTATGYSQILEHAEAQQSVVHGTLDKAANLAWSPKREQEAWVARVDEFLPQSLRSIQNARNDKPAKDTKSLPALLSKARSTTPLEFDVLGYIGIQEGRWDAVRWLFQSLWKEHEAFGRIEEQQRKKGFVIWSIAEPNPYETTSLDEISSVPVSFYNVVAGELVKVSDSPSELIRLGFDSNISRPEWLGQIWAMLAYMLLEAAEPSIIHASGQKIMSFVLETLAHLHHIDAVPRTIYNYRETSDSNESHKPPTLSLMAYRIMSELSDSAWKAQDEEIRAEGEAMGAKNWYKGHEMPEPTIQPRIDKLGKEIWLDLILWCCVEGGYYTEAAWVVDQMVKRKSRTPWKVIGWNDIRRPEESKVNWSVRAELEIAQSHMSRIGSGFGIAGPRELPPLVDMGPWTVSREVILTLIDGLGTSLRPVAEVERQLVSCRSLLSQTRSLTFKADILNKAVFNMFISRSVDAEEAPEAADRVLALTPICNSSSEDCDDSPQSKTSEESHDNGVSATFLGFLHRTLYSHSIKGNIQAALRTFRKIQKIIDADRQRHITEFAEDVKHAERTGDEDRLISESINNIIPSAYPQVPAHILSVFLDLLTDAHLYDFGNWLLYSDDVDGAFIHRSLYSEPNLQSALLRFAIATKNGQLFTDVSEKLQTPLAINTLRTILHCHITLGKWDAAEGIFRHLQLGPELGWREIDIMFVARSALRLEKDKESQPESLARARKLLQRLIAGEFNCPEDPSQPRKFWDYRRLYQIYLMLRTVRSVVYHIREQKFFQLRGVNAPISITCQAFNVLLEGIVETQGSLAGLQLWKRWCLPFQSSALIEIQDDASEFVRVIVPKIQTLRILTRPLVQQGKITNSAEKHLVEWAVTRYKEFGLSDKEIEWELPGL